MATLKNLITLTRPLSNVKTIAIIGVAFYLSGATLNISTLISVILALSAVCSAVYAFNSYTDRSIDKSNRNKRKYYSAVMYFGLRTVVMIIILLALSGMIIGFFVNMPFVLSLAALLITGFLYSSSRFRYKERFILDVLFGAILTFFLRFWAAWFAFSAAFPPLLPTIGLISAKAGGYMLYKELDRASLARVGVRNTITLLRKNTIIISSLSFIALAVISVIGMYFNLYTRIEWLGALPLNSLFLLPFAIPPIVIIYFQMRKITKFNNSVLRLIGFLYLLLMLVLAWRLL